MIRRLLLNTPIGMMILLVLASSSLRGVFASDFTLVPATDPLYTQLQTVRNAPWAGALDVTEDSATNVPLTRYELALEATKALIALRARHNADPNWIHTTAPEPIRALRRLCALLKSELPQFKVDVPATLKLLDELAAQTGSATPSPSVTRVALPAVTAQPQEREEPQSLSQRLRVYSALDSLARQANAPFRPTTDAGIQRLRAGASYGLSDDLRLRGEFEKENRLRPPGLREFLAGGSMDSISQNTRTLGASADWAPRPGLTLSGGVTRVDSDNPLNDGLRFESSVGLTGWQNRIALSAHLSRLVPEDSLALGQTAARLNLGVEVTSQIQLKLMYQQLFGATDAGLGNRRFGGGIDFNF